MMDLSKVLVKVSGITPLGQTLEAREMRETRKSQDL